MSVAFGHRRLVTATEQRPQETASCPAVPNADEIDIEDELKARWDAGFEDFEAFYAFEKKFADDVVELLGDKVDTIEKKISAAVPEVKHIDVEPD